MPLKTLCRLVDGYTLYIKEHFRFLSVFELYEIGTLKQTCSTMVTVKVTKGNAVLLLISYSSFLDGCCERCCFTW